ncbi:MAG: hypothetical protein QOH72_5455 [Solirubrobacteraceae bacterium]|jgi:hypothetical protein|nr:hypothetical protein [Solirubrobacteraceae bacterium]
MEHEAESATIVVIRGADHPRRPLAHGARRRRVRGAARLRQRRVAQAAGSGVASAGDSFACALEYGYA